MSPQKQLEKKYHTIMSIDNTNRTWKSIADEVDVSRSNVYRWYDQLAFEGSLKKRPGSGRKSSLTINQEIEIQLLALDIPKMVPAVMSIQ